MRVACSRACLAVRCRGSGAGALACMQRALSSSCAVAARTSVLCQRKLQMSQRRLRAEQSREQRQRRQQGLSVDRNDLKVLLTITVVVLAFFATYKAARRNASASTTYLR